MRSALRAPAAIAEALASKVGVRKVEEGGLNLLLLGILGGAYVAMGAFLATVVTQDSASFIGTGLSRFLCGGVFSLGLMLVVIAGAELFTGNSLMLMTVLDQKARARGLLRNWGIVYAANFAGALVIVLLVVWSGLWKSNAVGVTAVRIADAKVNLTFVEALTRGILCNWLVCLALWLAMAANTVLGKMAGCFFPVMAFVACGFEHSIANMYFIPIGLALKGAGLATVSEHLSLGGMIVRNLIPVTVGNILGGGIFVAGWYWLVYLRKGRSET